MRASSRKRPRHGAPRAGLLASGTAIACTDLHFRARFQTAAQGCGGWARMRANRQHLVTQEQLQLTQPQRHGLKVPRTEHGHLTWATGVLEAGL